MPDDCPAHCTPLERMEVGNADAYETLLKTRVLPELMRVAGYRGGYILRSKDAEEVELASISLNLLKPSACLQDLTIPHQYSSRKHDCSSHGSSRLPGITRFARALYRLTARTRSTKARNRGLVALGVLY